MFNKMFGGCGCGGHDGYDKGYSCGGDCCWIIVLLLILCNCGCNMDPCFLIIILLILCGGCCGNKNSGCGC